MRAESEMPTRHRWYHSFFSFKMGQWRLTAYNEKTSQVAYSDRVVRYCRLCRLDFHEGEELQKRLNLSVGLPPTLTPLFPLPAQVLSLLPKDGVSATDNPPDAP